MKIVIIGYGKMGQTIERLALKQGHDVVGHIDIHTDQAMKSVFMRQAEVGIEFSHPDAAYDNISLALENGLPIVCGTTGWLDRMESVKQKTNQNHGAFFYASNYSIGVNIFWAVNKKLAEMMNQYPDYEVSMKEVHHIHKKDEPSGTAITTAEQIISAIDRKSSWTLARKITDHEIGIQSIREGEVFGIHHVKYTSSVDTIELSHEAHTRDGFAQGAIIAAQWLIGKKGVFTMQDLLDL